MHRGDFLSPNRSWKFTVYLKVTFVGFLFIMTHTQKQKSITKRVVNREATPAIKMDNDTIITACSTTQTQRLTTTHSKIYLLNYLEAVS